MAARIFIATERLVLREWLPQDQPTYISMNQDPETMRFFPSLLTAEQSIAHMEQVKTLIHKKGYGLFAVERKDSNCFIGFTGFSHPGFEANFTPCVEIGWRLDKTQWGQGFATEAAKACLQFGFAMHGFAEVYAFTAIQNTRSEAVMKKSGMQKEGTFLHPKLENGHPLQKHVLYKINRPLTQ